MIQIQEQQSDTCGEYIEEHLSKLIKLGTFDKMYKRDRDKPQSCLSMWCNNDEIHFKTSYFIGVDWLIDNEVACYVKPKVDTKDKEIDYYSMLLEALEEPENEYYLSNLIHIDFTKPTIVINQREDILSLFLITEFLYLVKRIVMKGLKKSYYTVTEDLDSKVKGKILVDENIHKNLVFGRTTRNICRYQEFGINCDENKILKKTVSFIRQVVESYSNRVGQDIGITAINKILMYIAPAFHSVSENIEITQIKKYKSNPLYKEYDVAIKYAKIILKRFSYNIVTATKQQDIATPPFWIDMSKLFELYVLKKLKENFSQDKIEYQKSFYRQETPDFILKSSNQDIVYIIDAKYKPKYHYECIDIDDIRQVSGYGRIIGIHKRLGVPVGQEIKCLIIYANQECDKELKFSPYINEIKEETEFAGIYKIGISLPVK